MIGAECLQLLDYDIEKRGCAGCGSGLCSAICLTAAGTYYLMNAISYHPEHDRNSPKQECDKFYILASV